MSAKRINTRKHTKRKHAKVPGDMPSREDILAFVADNPGSWMFHCHIPEHQAGGMMGVIDVA